jgi:hypothetical protein
VPISEGEEPPGCAFRVTVRGEIDLATAARLNDLLTGLIDRGAHLVVLDNQGIEGSDLVPAHERHQTTPTAGLADRTIRHDLAAHVPLNAPVSESPSVARLRVDGRAGVPISPASRRSRDACNYIG